MEIRALEQIEGEMQLIRDRLIALDTDCIKTSALIESIKEKNTRLIVDSATNSKHRKPQSITVQQNLLRQEESKLQGLRMAKNDLEVRLPSLQRELERTLIYEQVRSYSHQENQFNQATQTVFTAIKLVNTELEKLEALIAEYLHCPAGHLEVLGKLIKEPINDLSYRDFLQGEIVPCDPSINNAFLAEIAQHFNALSNQLPKIKDVSKSWQNLQSKLLALSMFTSGMVPKSSKYVETSKATQTQKTVPFERPPEPFKTIGGKPYRWNPDEERYVPIRERKVTASWGVMA